MVVTRCPNCHARFRVSDGQLKLAAGQVRCGACLLVFDAQQHRVRPAPTRKAEAATPASAAPEPAQTSNAGTETAKPRPKAATPQAPVAESKAPQQPAIEASVTRKVETETAKQAELFQAVPETAQESTHNDTANRPDTLDGFRTEALHLGHPADNDPNPVRTTGWLLLCLLAILGLGAQLIWFERAQLARYSELSSVYALLCDQVDCSLERPTLAFIENHGLILQPHPQYRDALNATILLENRAPFEQPWPALSLRFTDLKGRVVAQRTFQPDEYLDAETLDPKQMPPGQSMQINLELAAPGRRGASYELELVAPL